MGISLRCRDSDYLFHVFSTYLPPENSNYGRDAQKFFDYLLGQLYNYSADDVILVGDLNAKIGKENDIVLEQINGPTRLTDQLTKNSHGQSFLEFLEGGHCCIANGRFGVNSSSCTSITSKGSSLIDSVYLPYKSFDIINKMEIVDTTDIFERLNLHKMIGKGVSMPDHNIIKLGLNIQFNTDTLITEHAHGTIGRKGKRVHRTFPEDFMEKSNMCNILCNLIENIEANRLCQKEMDSLYDNMLENIEEILEQHIETQDTHHKHTPYKPYWCSELSLLWKDMIQACKYYKNSNDCTKRSGLLSKFEFQRKLFDTELKRRKHEYCRNINEKVEKIKTGNPKDFWNFINKFGPQRDNKIKLVMNRNGVVISNASSVIDNWYTKYKNLFFNPTADTLEKSNVNDYNYDRNSKIEMWKVKKAISQTKNNKGVGKDNISNEFLKLDGIDTVLYKLFCVCHSSGIVPNVWNETIIVPIPKGAKSSPFDPLSYRGLSLQSCIYEVYSNVIDNRLYNFVEEHNLLHEAQNGFRKKRSTIEHVYSLVQSVELNKKLNGKPSYVCFVDFRKAFDTVSRCRLYEKLKSKGISDDVLKFYLCSNKDTNVV